MTAHIEGRQSDSLKKIREGVDTECPNGNWSLSLSLIVPTTSKTMMIPAVGCTDTAIKCELRQLHRSSMSRSIAPIPSWLPTLEACAGLSKT